VHDEGGRGARPHACLALDAVLEAEDAALVLDQIEDVGRTDGDARVASGAAIIIDAVDENSHLGAIAPARAAHAATTSVGDRDQRHDGQRQTSEDGRNDEAHWFQQKQSRCRDCSKPFHAVIAANRTAPGAARPQIPAFPTLIAAVSLHGARVRFAPTREFPS
jgi:hypothetical protein